jgi:hypothetical protein
MNQSKRFIHVIKKFGLGNLIEVSTEIERLERYFGGRSGAKNILQ